MPENTILELINANLTNPLGFAFFCLLVDDWRFPPKVMRWIYVLFPIFICTVQSLLFLSIDDFVLKRLIMSVVGCGIGICFALSSTNYRKGRVVFIALTDFSLLLTGNAISECIGSTSTPQRLFVKIIIYILLALFLCLLFRPPLLKLLREKGLNWYKLSLIPAIFAALLLFLMISGRLYYDQELKIIAATIVGALCVCYVAIYSIFYTLKGSYDLRADNELLRSQMSHLQSQADTLQNSYNQVRIFRHDMRHFMQIQAACLESGDTEAAQRLLRSMQESLDVGLDTWAVRSYTGKPLLDAVLSNYTARAEKAGVAFEMEFTLPEALPAPADELAVVLANALENALNACVRLHPKDFREIRLQGIQNGEQYLLVVSNTFNGVVEFNHTTGLPVTRETGHGYGTQSIAAFAKQHGAALDYAVKDGWFSLRILF